MKNSFSFLVLIALSLVLILVVVTYYLFSKINANSTVTEKNVVSGGTDALRKHAVNDLASKISYISADSSLIWPTEWQQIGNGTTDCEVHTQHCQVDSSSCFDLQTKMAGKFKLPIDSSQGSEEKTGYAIRLVNEKLEIRACFTESQSVITQELRL